MHTHALNHVLLLTRYRILVRFFPGSGFHFMSTWLRAAAPPSHPSPHHPTHPPPPHPSPRHPTHRPITPPIPHRATPTPAKRDYARSSNALMSFLPACALSGSTTLLLTSVLKASLLKASLLKASTAECINSEGIIAKGINC